MSGQGLLIPGAGCGMGVEIAQAALGAGPKVIATARRAREVGYGIGDTACYLARLPSDRLEASFKNLKVTAQCPVQD
jgi:NADP-dependent 3-hydroxy acid dehydrogenase YdfG